MYIPHGWVIMYIPKTNIYKLFAGWVGDYLTGDHWRINSGITSATKPTKNDYYIFGESGSCYKCNKNTYNKLSLYHRGVLGGISGITILSKEDAINFLNKFKDGNN